MGILVGGLLVSAGMARAEVGVTDNEIVIGSCHNFDPAINKTAVDIFQGAKSYVDSINEEGGVNGRKIRIVEGDDQDKIDQAVLCFRKLQEAGVFANAFFAGTVPNSKHVPMTEAAKTPLVGVYVGSRYVYEPFKHYVFSLHGHFGDSLFPMVDHLWNDLGFRKIAIIRQDDVYGIAQWKELSDALAAHHSAFMGEATFARHSTDVSQAVDKVKAENPQAVFLIGNGSDSIAAILKYAKKIGWHPVFLTAFMDPGLVTMAGDASENLVILRVFPSPESDLPAAVQYKKLLKKSYPDAKPSSPGFEGYTYARVLVEGLKRAGKDLTREKLISSLESMHAFDTGIGKKYIITFGPNDHKGFEKPSYVVVKNGQTVDLDDWKTLK